MASDAKFDDLLLGIARKHKNSEELMFSILSFFERRTDLFHVMETPQDRMGFRAGQAQDMFLNQFHHFQGEYVKREQPHLEPNGTARTTVEEVEGTFGTPPGSSGDAASSAAEAPSAAVAARAAAQAAADSKPDLPEPSAEPAASGSDEAAVPDSTRKAMKHISTWNGGVNEKYYWSQTIYEVTVEVQVEQDSRAKEIEVDITPTRLTVKCRGKTCVEGKLHEKVTCDQCVWHLDDGKVIISFEKQRQTWWKCVLEGDPEIDTTKVESTRTMDEYDGETQGAIRKIMFDQCQKAKGAPTSDQIRTADVMKDAWNAPGSPFRGTDFDPTLLNLSGPVPDDFFSSMEQRRIEEQRAALGSGKAAEDNGTGGSC